MGNQWDSQKLKPLDAFSSFDKRIPITAGKMHNGFIVTNDMFIDAVEEGSEDKFFISVGANRFLVKDSSINQRRKENL